LLRRSVFFVTCLLIASSAVGQTGQLEIKAPWARATPGQAQNGAAYLMIVSPTTDRLTAAPGRKEGRAAHDVNGGRGYEDASTHCNKISRQARHRPASLAREIEGWIIPMNADLQTRVADRI
jgi:hypothetical protein